MMKFQITSIFDIQYSSFEIQKGIAEGPKHSKAPDGQGPLLTNYKPKL